MPPMTNNEASPNTAGSIDKLFRRLVGNRLSSLKSGSLQVHDSLGSLRFGDSSELCATITLHSPRFFRRAVLGGELSVAEAYLQGEWDCDDLTSFFRIFIRNRTDGSLFKRSFLRMNDLIHGCYHWLRENTRQGSRRNISAHYDVGNDFYRLWLDPSLAYSCGIFTAEQSSLNDASLEKFDRVCRKLELSDQDHLIEIGTGWGGFALHAVEKYACRITTTTISAQQHAIARQRFAEFAQSDRIELLQADYRDLKGEFDKLVSIEMIEAVGYRFLDRYFARCSELLRPDGTMVLQAIVMPERNYQSYLKSVDFIQRYVFPGGCLPSVAAMLESAGRATDLRFVHAEDFAPHYAETLRRWRCAFEEQIDVIRKMGFSEPFIRLWRYYLCYCEAAFEERCVGVVQVQFDKPKCRRDPKRISRNAAEEFQRSPSHRKTDMLERATGPSDKELASCV